MRKYFFTGLVTLLPLAATLWLVLFVVHFLTQPFMGIVTAFLFRYPITSFGIVTSDQIIRTISQIIILISLFLFTLFLGFVARKFFFSSILRIGDQILHKIPLVNKIYKTSKEIVLSLFSTKTGSFKQTVMIPFPRKGSYCLGLISRDAPQGYSDNLKSEMLSVFIPTAPNPTTGFLVMCAKADMIFLDMKSEEAIKYIVSCGVIQPDKQGELFE